MDPAMIQERVDRYAGPRSDAPLPADERLAMVDDVLRLAGWRRDRWDPTMWNPPPRCGLDIMHRYARSEAIALATTHDERIAL